jgi:uncharacterized Tic20 family protein
MNQLGTKIIQTRKMKGISQEKLSEAAQINLRTIQRIEKGDTYPHGDTLQRIAKALGTPLEDLVEDVSEENLGYIKAMHFSTLIFLLIPSGNIILPLLFWLIKKNQVKNISFFAKKLINFQITWSLLAYFPFVLVLLSTFIHIDFVLPSFIKVDLFSIIMVEYFVWYPLNAIYVIIVGLLIKTDPKNYFPITIRFIK